MNKKTYVGHSSCPSSLRSSCRDRCPSQSHSWCPSRTHTAYDTTRHRNPRDRAPHTSPRGSQGDRCTCHPTHTSTQAGVKTTDTTQGHTIA